MSESAYSVKADTSHLVTCPCGRKYTFQDSEALVRELRTELECAAYRFRMIRDETKCIGSTLCHVDGNCPHCVADFSARKIASRLGEK